MEGAPFDDAMFTDFSSAGANLGKFSATASGVHSIQVMLGLQGQQCTEMEGLQGIFHAQELTPIPPELPKRKEAPVAVETVTTSTTAKKSESKSKKNDNNGVKKKKTRNSPKNKNKFSDPGSPTSSLGGGAAFTTLSPYNPAPTSQTQAAAPTTSSDQWATYSSYEMGSHLSLLNSGSPYSTTAVSSAYSGNPSPPPVYSNVYTNMLPQHDYNYLSGTGGRHDFVTLDDEQYAAAGVMPPELQGDKPIVEYVQHIDDKYPDDATASSRQKRSKRNRPTTQQGGLGHLESSGGCVPLTGAVPRSRRLWGDPRRAGPLRGTQPGGGPIGRHSEATHLLWCVHQ
ncbi:unnamed protein product [Nesidiocoris tenuis]|uniref:Uncharacterized protein n=1 Tax=Nesidiocoris tenuis TaxID=355587 RepID=A0A6H5FWN3_9HEMI|nr:unnamed protein product [Nesidiocoris tenuis]